MRVVAYFKQLLYFTVLTHERPPFQKILFPFSSVQKFYAIFCMFYIYHATAPDLLYLNVISTFKIILCIYIGINCRICIGNLLPLTDGIITTRWLFYFQMWYTGEGVLCPPAVLINEHKISLG